MFNIYKLDEEIWTLASSHTQLVDAEAQMQRFIDQGIPAENLKIEQE